ncbi:DNA recombination protein RmuC [Sphingopyxis soli]|uniref:DNA recombination protein RmuC homolog n=1 Tax=Sphingopyxis soli TaxID=592051 RepID=A0ABN1MB01_9SPHN|nr:DNA recombination protein RmuC [Sphingopyxis soli]
MDVTALAIALAALCLGGLIGWLLAGRQAGVLKAERDGLSERFRAAVTDLAAEAEARKAADIRLSALLAEQKVRDEAHEAQIAQLRDAQTALTAQFREVGQTMLDKAQQDFLSRAADRFKQSEDMAEQKIAKLLQPVTDSLKQYDEKLGAIEKARVGSYAELNKAISDLALSNDVVRKEASRLANVMTSSPKARGRWGEQQLLTILESAGLAENIDFALQTSVNDGERQLRPDCIINLPGDRCIVIDVKCPLVHFEAAYDEDDETKRAHLLLQHANALRTYAADLGRKGYWQQFEKSPDFVVMFVPGEHFLSAAAERAPDLIEGAFRNGVIIASTINMLALAKVMAGMWRQEKLMGQAREIADLGKELHARLYKMGEHVAKVGQNLQRASSAYNDFLGSLDRQVISSAKKFESLNIDTGGKSLETPPMIESAIRPSAKLTSAPAAVNDGE